MAIRCHQCLIFIGSLCVQSTTRDDVLSGKVIVIVAAGIAEKRFIYEKAKAWGVRLIMIDTSSSWGRELVDLGIVETFITCDCTEHKADSISGRSGQAS